MKKFLITAILALALLPQVSLGQSTTTDRSGTPCGGTSQALCNPIQSVTDVPGFLKYALVFVGGFLGFIAIATLVYAGIRMVTANGNEKTIGESKTTITYTVAGFIAAVLAYAGVVAIEKFIGVKTTTPAKPNTIFNPFGSGATLQGLAGNLLQNVILISGVLALLMIVWNGFRYATARGDEKQTASAKTAILWSLVGLVIILFAYVIINAVAQLIS